VLLASRAKPVPVNPRNFRGNYRRDDFLVSVAGVATNLTLFIISLFLATWSTRFCGSGSDYRQRRRGGAHLLKRRRVRHPAERLGRGLQPVHASPVADARAALSFAVTTMNLAIAVFNLLPIPPLDGFHVLNDLILKGKLTMNRSFFQIAQVCC
jgi:Zn-dependent protease